MEILERREEDNHVWLKIRVDSEKFEEVYFKHFKNLSKSISIAGFRKGLAPMNMVLKYLKNKGYLTGECERIASKLVDLSVSSIMEKDKSLDKQIFGYPVDRNLVEFDADKKSMIFDAKFEKYPTVEVGDYSSIPTLIETKDFSDFCPVPRDKISEKNDVLAISMLGKNDKNEIVFKYTYDILEVDLENTKLRKELTDVLVGMKAKDSKTVEIQDNGEKIKVEILVLEVREKKPINEELLKELKLDENVTMDKFVETFKKQYEMHNSFVRYQDIVKWLFSEVNKVHPLPIENLKFESGKSYQAMFKKGHKNVSLENIFRDFCKNFKVTIVLNEISKLEKIEFHEEDKESFMRDIEEHPWLYGYKTSEEIFNSSDEVLKEYVIQFKTLQMLMSRWHFSN